MPIHFTAYPVGNFSDTNNREMIPGKVYRKVDCTLPTTDGVEVNYFIRVERVDEDGIVLAHILYPPNPARTSFSDVAKRKYPGMWYYGDGPECFELIEEERKCPHCRKMVEPDLLMCCPECGWLLKGGA